MADPATSTRSIDLKAKSLPKNPVEAKNQYPNWLSELAKKSGVENFQVDLGQGAGMSSAGFTVHRYVLTGEVRLDNLIKLLHGYYDRDYLQRIRSLKLTQVPTNPELVKIRLDTEALALAVADRSQPVAGTKPGLRLRTRPAIDQLDGFLAQMSFEILH